MTIEFNLFAPRNEAVELIGSFSDWQGVPMEKDETGFFRVQLELKDGDYQYKFRIKHQDKWIETNDPYMTEMDRKTQNGIVHIKEGQRILDTFIWQHDDSFLPDNRDLVLYEMHIADFCNADPSDPTKFKQALEKLDYLSELGINAIALMPITEYAGDYRWGYMPQHFFALESSYGKPADFKSFVDECHARGIRVFIDCIFNHTHEESPLLLIDRDYWYYHDRHYPEDDANYWGPELSYENYDPDRDIRPTWNYVNAIVQFWTHEYHIDGIRYDAVRQIANDEFFGWLFEQVKVPKPFFHIAEHIPDSSEICKPQGVFDACWHESFRYFLTDLLIGKDIDFNEFKSAIAAQPQGYAEATSVINYLATHDREHLIVELQDAGIDDLDRIKLGAMIQFTALGIPMLWMGDEFGQDTYKTETTTEPNPLDWSLLQKNQPLFDFYKRLIALRHEKSSLRSDNLEFFHENGKVLAYVRWNEAGERMVVVANFSDQDFENYAIDHFPADGTWKDWSDGQEVDPSAIDLPSFSAKILLQ
ncbi:alpha amylase [Leptolyngbya boryana NIES-2135]|jgi:1,4-alpha-glucan branching enzyme|uniref:Alpha amylase n=1 Tax=Leptolyngbya boryana NIES-2135 TaxID=1973484 RepID=A0A1Z4JE80_LEPBY|nr:MULTISPECIES: alpha-amylase family glycosyl hydrolase [Leptolyngbya]BAY55085.1 alpha amylase [Leptolyngbya boryana NIES-2135]MBD2366065.1 alpha amylase C-terminal domain-containing protein [Leptolyngbya sp. FACHB-161]MBD2372245.1 alpha amylase C-terminal domain-containing protein [Leptolyngbya sp. FACHB-238]MBD2396668.1 alpha amylase C-terminal domain-containing protein [Leptolyngbya sp. FACHB-239]MBD2403191.1 alpha amylase C-terminal domain-containing protein [Leptolyngbya sp. FACHB-402]